MNKSSRTLLLYVAALALLIMFGVMLSSPTNTGTKLKYYELLELINKDIAAGGNGGEGIDVVSIRGNTLIGRYESKLSRVSQTDYPNRYDFETTIDADFIDTVKTMVANAAEGKTVDEISVSDFPFKVEYLAPVSTSRSCPRS